MTTIAYNHKDKQIAVDSRISGGNYIYTDHAIKRIDRDDRYFVLAGSNCMFDEFIDAVINNKPYTDGPANAFGVMVIGGAAYDVRFEDKRLCLLRLDFSESWGSGDPYAISAMDFGKSAKEAVEYAMTRDCKTGGKVHVYEVE